MNRYIRPNPFLAKVVNPIVSHWPRMPALIVRGRRSGRLLTIPMGEPLELDGRRYLVAGRGETHWVRNLRSAGRASFRIHGRVEPFRATELQGEERERVVEGYRRQLGRRLDPYFERLPLPADHPVFRMDSIEDASSARNT